jgi:uncharacterized protein (DUF2252 family)
MNSKKLTVAKRQSVLNKRRNLKMARSAYAYVRGNTVKFYDWLQTDSGSEFQAAPQVRSMEIAMSETLAH